MLHALHTLVRRSWPLLLCYGCGVSTDANDSRDDEVPARISAELTTALKINFQTSTTATPSGYSPDVGLAFGDRGGDLAYGWNGDNTAQARERSGALDKRYDTFNQLQRPANPNAVWEVAVPNGTYNVRIVSGDPFYYDSVFKLSAEGVLVVDGTPTDSQRWFEGSALVTVSDGRLTVGSAAGAFNNKLSFIEVTSASDPNPQPPTEPTPPPTPPGGTGTAKINFQVPTTATPSGYSPDVGLTFGARSGGLSYGWNVDNTAQARERNLGAPDKRYDTFNHLQLAANPNAVWELALPNGKYNVRVVAGDSAYYDSVFKLSAEGVLIVNGTPTDSQRWLEGTALVTVSDGRLTINSATGAVNNKLCYVDVEPAASSSAPPSIAAAATAAQNPSFGSTTTLSVLGADDGGEANLSYTWAVTGSAPGPVTFSANGTNAAKATNASFTKAGAYSLQVTVSDAGGSSATSSVSVTVAQTLTSASITPASVLVAPGGVQQFAASAQDQFGSPLAGQPSTSWSASGNGSVNASGLFKAGAGAGTATVTATLGGKSAAAAVTVSAATAQYSTNFDRNEAPISEGGAWWMRGGVSWTPVHTAGGFAFGTQSGFAGNGGYDDSYAILSGFPANHTASAVIHLEPGITAASAEVEILLRWADSANNVRGYECNLSHNGNYAEIVRWNGPYRSFTYIARATAVGAVRDGDVFSARVEGNRVTSYLNGRQLVTGTDDMFSDGNPGMGFFWRGQQGSSKYGYTSFSASGL